jgi:putative DNA methylase
MRSLIEDYLPIGAISGEAAREKSLWRGHISTLHLWWARRPLVSARAAVYGALTPATKFQPTTGPEEKRASLGRANATKFFKTLCSYPGTRTSMEEAERHLLEAHAARLTEETGEIVTAEDIKAGRAPRPRVLDMFTGGGAIPLEALRLGCQAFALDLNPVAHIIELCGLKYPQSYGDATKKSFGANGGTWAGLANEVGNWGSWVQDETTRQLRDLYEAIPDPSRNPGVALRSRTFWASDPRNGTSPLLPVAYIWTRTVHCKNPTCKAVIPLVRQTWLCKKEGRLVAIKINPVREEKLVRFEVLEAAHASDLGFDPDSGSSAGNTTCPFCGTIADVEYVKDEGWNDRLGTQLMAVVATRPRAQGKVFLGGSSGYGTFDEDTVIKRIERLCEKSGLSLPLEQIANLSPESRNNTLGITVRPYGLTTWNHLFTRRQMLCLLTFVDAIRRAHSEMRTSGYADEHAIAVTTYLGTALDRLAENCSTLCRWNATAEKMQGTFGRQALPMVWDFCEANPFGGAVGDWRSIIDLQINAINGATALPGLPAEVVRGSAMSLPWPAESMDAVVTDPPYYDNVPYADISDFFYVWLRRSIGHLYPEHFATAMTPKKQEAVADAGRHGGSNEKARVAYEEMMGRSFGEAYRVLKPGGQLVVVYAHKTTLGWSTLVEALRTAGFQVLEAWPLDTEMKSRLRGRDSSALASSIFLVARKRESELIGRYEHQVRPDLEKIVNERSATLWDLGVSGADLVIACVGAGLRAFTAYPSVEYANGEQIPAKRFLTEVETVVLETILARLSKEVGGNGGRYGLASVDPSTRFYTLWRFTYRSAELDAGEAIIFANGTHVELDGLDGLSRGSRPLVQKKKGKYRLLDYIERGDDAKLGAPKEDGSSAPLIDALHRLLWLMERHPSGIPEFLREARPNMDQLRLVAQALAGPALKGSELGEVATGTELAALTKLTANWRSVVEDVAEAAVGPLFRATRKNE